MARVGTKKKKMRWFQEFKESLEQQAPTLGAYAKTRSEIWDVLPKRRPLSKKSQPD